MFNNKLKIVVTSIIFTLLMVLNCLDTKSQTRIISPYSMYGIGELHNQKLSRNIGMGGIGYGYRNNHTVNYLNPASYTEIDSMSFVFEAVGFSHFYTQETATQSQQSNYSSLGNLVFGFPVSNRIGVGFGVKPYSLVGYKVIDREIQPDGNHINYMYDGSGGLNEAFLGTSVKLIDELSLGVNASYVFGSIENRKTIYSEDISGFFKSYRRDFDYIKGFLFGVGLQYDWKISENRRFVTGVTYGFDNNLDIERSKLIQRELPGSTNLDTLNYTSEKKGELTIPKNLGAGTWFIYNENWSGGIDFKWQNWDNYKRFGLTDEVQDSYNVALGIKYSPTTETYTGIFRHAKYMAGFRYGESHLNIDNYSFDEFGISFGVYLPIRRTQNGMTIGFEYSQRGTKNQQLIEESLYRINIGVNIYERWFMRRRFY